MIYKEVRELNKMPDISYQLKSRPGIYVNIPEEYAHDAQNLVDQTVNGNLMKMKDSPYLGNPGILSRALALSKTPSSKSLADSLYLIVCIKQNERCLSFGQGNHPDSELDSRLISLVEQVEAKSEREE
jgi:hypothetical protein